MSSEKIEVENRIFTFRGEQVMVDRDLAELYQVETKRLNEQVKRNIERFPKVFRFQLNDEEVNELVANSDRFSSLRSQSVTSSDLKYLRSQSATSSKHGGRRYAPYAFTEQGIAMLSAVLRSDIAVQISIQIMNAFVEMRKQLQGNQLLISRMDKMEHKQLKTDQKMEQIFKALESKLPEKEKGVFFDGQVFDAYTFVADVVRQAKSSIVLIDNYVDDTVLTLLSKRNKNVKCTICTKSISKQLKLDVKKHNEQYAKIELLEFKEAHDRFLILDNTVLYHIGASIKDLGKKWFAFSKINTETVNVLGKLKSIGV